MNGDERPHFVVCGSDPLAYWVVRSLLATDSADGRVRVTLVVPARRRSEGPDGRDVPGVRVVTAERLDEAAFR
ncbi:potassium transporter TrkA, partial [Micromonospora chalcea]